MIERTNDFELCTTEQQFKKMYIRKRLQKVNRNIFCIETEETVHGFPDVMLLDIDNKASFYEFKISDKQGNIKFQPTQPAFYRTYPSLGVFVVAYNKVTKFVHCFNTAKLFDNDSAYRIDDRATVNLSKVEKQYESVCSKS